MTTDRKSASPWSRAALVGLTAAAAIFTGLIGRADAQTVTTPGGTFPAETFQGVAGNDITTFLGIRYAAAPTGNLRFAPPTPPAAVAGTVNATQFGSGCPQTASPFGIASNDEDCLFLNVYVPGSSVSARNRLPVMVFYHGGAFVFGEGSIYNPTQMAIQGNTIVVTINYRLGILGYLADAALDTVSAQNVSGNYGLRDQQFALKWVQQNISAFGGNPNDVTIFGESAGGFSVCANIVSPAARGTFQKAITESGPCATPLPTKAAAEAGGAQIVSALGCADATAAETVACLRALPISTILAVTAGVTNGASLASLFAFFPNVDGVLIPQEPILSIALGQYNHVPVIEGTNHDEGRLFVALAFDLNPKVGPLTAAEYPTAVAAIAATAVQEGQAALASLNGGNTTTNSSSTQQEIAQITQEILNEYPLKNFSSPDVALATILTDSGFSCPANISSELFSLQTPTFAYEFNDENAPMLFLPPVSFPYGATHTDELQFLFNFPNDPLSANEQRLATTMKGYWTNFARNGNPNGSGDPTWPGLSILADDIQSLTAPTPSVEFNFAQDHKCNFWVGILVQTALAGIANQLSANGIFQ
jgi:para-nitrobenzyl esterase